MNVHKEKCSAEYNTVITPLPGLSKAIHLRKLRFVETIYYMWDDIIYAHILYEYLFAIMHNTIEYFLQLISTDW